LSRDQESFKHQKQLSRLGVDFHIDGVLIESIGSKPIFDLGCGKGVGTPAQSIKARVVVYLFADVWWNADKVDPI